MSESRRTFLQTSGAAVAAGFLNLNPRAAGANEKIALALIGGRNQGKHVVLEAIQAGAEIKTFCDLDDAILAKTGDVIEKAQGKRPEFVKDFRRVLDDKAIDGVIIATPDHWHANITIPACQAGKDVYIEKPLSQTIREGQLMRDAARKYSRVMQVGTQRRSMEHFRTAVEYVASGKLGKICLIKTWMCQVRESIGNPADGPVPAGVDYDMWLGPAPKRPFNINRFHYNWRFFWDYGNTELGNQGVHMLDVAMWGIEKLRGVEYSLPKHVAGTSGIYWLQDAKEVPDTQVLTYDYGDFMLTWELRSFAKHDPVDGTADATAFYGTDAALVTDDTGWVVYDKDNKVVEQAKPAGGSHAGNFLECMKSRKRPNADVELGRLSTTICHLGNIATRLKRDVVFDPRTETFGDDQEANGYLVKEYRKGWELPGV